MMSDEKPIQEEFADIMAEVPPEQLASLPVDGAANHDKYLYGDKELTDAEKIAEYERMKRDYSLFEECSPPDRPRHEFVEACFDAWEEKQLLPRVE